MPVQKVMLKKTLKNWRDKRGFPICHIFFGCSNSSYPYARTDNLFTLAHSIAKGKNAGIFTTLGHCTGLLVHITAATYWFMSSRIPFKALNLSVSEQTNQFKKAFSSPVRSLPVPATISISSCLYFS